MNTKISNKKSVKFLLVFLTITIIFTPLLFIFPTRANAQFGIPTPTIEIPGPLLGAGISTAVSSGITAGGTTVNTLKETVGDGFAWFALNMVIERLAASTINWINTGFKGSPAYITSSENYFLDIGNKIAGEFIANDPRLSQLCGPISARVRIALTSNYIGERQWQCTLSEVTGNLEDFMGDFSQGGWDNFFEVTQRDQNNPIGAYLQAQNELSLQLSSAQETKKMELQWSSGFLSKKECVRYDKGAPGETVQMERLLVGIDPEGNEIYQEQIRQKLPDVPPKCLEERTSTPGSVIENQLNDVLGLGNKRLSVADELNEIIASLLNQLTAKAIGSVSRGLRSLSSPDTANNNKTFTNELSPESNQEIIEEYFEKTQENINEGLDIIPPDVTFCQNNPYAPECLPGEPQPYQKPEICLTNPSDPACQNQP